MNRLFLLISSKGKWVFFRETGNFDTNLMKPEIVFYEMFRHFVTKFLATEADMF